MDYFPIIDYFYIIFIKPPLTSLAKANSRLVSPVEAGLPKAASWKIDQPQRRRVGKNYNYDKYTRKEENRRAIEERQSKKTNKNTVCSP